MNNVPTRIYNQLEAEFADVLYKYQETVKELHELQDKNFNMMRDYANMIVWLQLNQPDAYLAYKGRTVND